MEFLIASERKRLIASIDRQVVKQGLRQLRCGTPAQAPVSIAISVSSVSDESFRGFLLDELASARVDPARINFMIDALDPAWISEPVLGFIGQLRKQGYALSLGQRQPQGWSSAPALCGA